MSISAGKYLIHNKGAEAFVHRGLQKDKSFSSQEGHLHFARSANTTSESPISCTFHILSGLCLLEWSIETDDKLYLLKVNGAPAFSKDGHVFVSLHGDSGIDVKWNITAVPNVGEHVCM